MLVPFMLYALCFKSIYRIKGTIKIYRLPTNCRFCNIKS